MQNGVRTITVRIPAGVKDGQRIRLAGKGSPGERGGPAGDLFVVVHVSAHPLFGRSGDDLTLTLPVTFPEAALGATVRVPTLDGAVTLKMPPGTSNGRTFRVRGKGVQRQHRQRRPAGDRRGGGAQDAVGEAENALETYAAGAAGRPASARSPRAVTGT